MTYCHCRRNKDGSVVIKNAIATSSVADSLNNTVTRDVTNLRYYWKHNDDAVPEGIFELPEFTCTQGGVPSKTLVWPLTGIAVAKRGGSVSDVRLVLTGTVECITEGDANSMNFEPSLSFIVVVTNPYDAPDTWKYSTKAIPTSKSKSSDLEPVKW